LRAVAVRQKKEAEQQKAAAEKHIAEARLNQSRFLTEKAEEAVHDGKLELAELAALAALPLNTDARERPIWISAVFGARRSPLPRSTTRRAARTRALRQ
jgi:hypothetical protein